MDPAPAGLLVEQLRPGRIWYVVAALIAAGGVLAAAVVLALVPVGGDLGQRITLGEPVTVHMPETGRMVWVRGGGEDVPDLRCEPSPSGGARIEEWSAVSTRPDGLTLDADGQRWHGLLKVRPRPAGTYTLVCTAADGTASLWLGDPPRFSGTRARALADVAAPGLAFLGVLVAIVLTAVVANRRRNPPSGATES